MFSKRLKTSKESGLRKIQYTRECLVHIETDKISQRHAHLQRKTFIDNNDDDVDSDDGYFDDQEKDISVFLC